MSSLGRCATPCRPPRTVGRPAPGRRLAHDGSGRNHPPAPARTGGGSPDRKPRRTFPSLLELQRAFPERRHVFGGNPRSDAASVQLRLRGLPRQRPGHLQARRSRARRPGNPLVAAVCGCRGEGVVPDRSGSRPGGTNPVYWSAISTVCPARCARCSTPRVAWWRATCRKWSLRCGRSSRRPSCAFPRRSDSGSNAAAGSSRGWLCVEPTSKTSNPASGRGRKPFYRFFRIKGKGCCISLALNALCSPTRWGWAGRFRRWPPARCSGGSSGSIAFWSRHSHLAPG